MRSKGPEGRDGAKPTSQTDSVKSAECLRNFTLLACEIVSPEDLFSPSGSNGPEKSKDSQIGIHGDLPFNENQPRAPKGQPDGGQWIKVDGGENGGEESDSANHGGLDDDSYEKDSYTGIDSEEAHDDSEDMNPSINPKEPDAKPTLTPEELAKIMSLLYQSDGDMWKQIADRYAGKLPENLVPNLDPDAPQMGAYPEQGKILEGNRFDENIIYDLFRLPQNIIAAYKEERKAAAILEGDFDKIDSINKENDGYFPHSILGEILNDAIKPENLKNILGAAALLLSRGKAATGTTGAILGDDIAQNVTSNYEHARRCGMTPEDARNAAIEGLKNKVGSEIALQIAEARLKGPIKALAKNSKIGKITTDAATSKLREAGSKGVNDLLKKDIEEKSRQKSK